MTATTPRKRAILIGIDRYPNLGKAEQLRGCVNDVELLSETLQERFGFSAEDMTILRNEQATRDAILAAMERLAEQVERDDVVVMSYSGHGSQMLDREEDELDGYDETLVPFDSGRGFEPNRDITDDEIYAWLLRLTKKTSNVTLIFDCCHSGTGALGPDEVSGRWIPADTRSLDELPESPIEDPEVREGLRTHAQSRQQLGASEASRWLPLSSSCVLISGCRDSEVSHEYRPDEPGKKTYGALTYFLTRCLAQAGPDLSYGELIEQLRAEIGRVYGDQCPQLTGEEGRRVFA